MSDWWDDFSNNLATDLGPLIALFGETPTKQYLSECLHLVDIIVFASCPLGILTAVVSAIRVCGTPSLRAFIGRAQEGGGSAEAELCSSTSRDVCELYNNGGIARVFGRPKLLEFVHVTGPFPKAFNPLGHGTRTAGNSRDNLRDSGLYSSLEYFDHLSKDDEWCELGNTHSPDQERQKPNTKPSFAPNPNLSLNVGIKPRHRLWFIFAAAFGVMMQCAVLLWAVIARYTLRLLREGSEDYYAIPMTLAGTVLLCTGMAFCASLVERSTDERVFKRKPARAGVRTTSIYWVQPGNQHVGDQVFDSFAYTDSIDRYTTSWKKKNETSMVSVWTAVSMTMIGFILQFLGLRACHSSVAVAQLGGTLVMSLVRAGLRTERLKKDDNPLNADSKQPDLFQGHELDWLALQLEGDGAKLRDRSCPPKWYVSTSAKLQGQHKKGIVRKRPGLEQEPLPKTAAKLFYFRAQLGELTGLNPGRAQGSSTWDDNQIVVRRLARVVAQAMEMTTQILFDEKSAMPVVLVEEWNGAPELCWPLPCMTYSTRGSEDCLIYLSLKREDSKSEVLENSWRANVPEIEAALGLWLWSLKCQMRPRTEDIEEHHTARQERGFSRLISLNQNDEVDFELWRRKGDSAIRKSRVAPPSYWKHSSAQREPGRPPEDLDCSGQWRFGWHIMPADQCSKDKVDVLEMSTTSSLASACAQDIYASFLLAALDMVKNIGGKSLIESPSLRQANGNVSSILEAFTTSGLGSTADAFTCILPALKYHNLLPRAADALSQVRSDARQLVRAQEWENAEKLLRWAITLSEPKELEASTGEDLNEYRLSLLLLCECYRKALLSSGSASIGIEGISLLLDNPVSPLVRGTLTLQTSADAQSLLTDTLNSYARAILTYARDCGITQNVDELERKLRRVQHTPTIPSTTLYEAMKSSELAKALYRLGREKPKKAISTSQRTPLSYAAEWGWYPVVQSLVEDGSPVEETDALDRTPLSYAAVNGDRNTFGFLLNKDPFPDSGDNRNRTALSYAAENNRLDILEMLLKDQRVNAGVEDREGRTALWWAIRRGHEDAARVLLKKTRVKSAESFGRGKLLHWAVVHGMQEVAKQILEKGVKVNAQENHQHTSALEAGSAAGHESIVELLLSKGADPNIGGGFFGSPLQAARAFGHEAIAKLLLKWNADPCSEGETHPSRDKDILKQALAAGNELIIQILLNSGVKVQGSSALKRAISLKNEEIVRILLENGSDINALVNDSRTALEYAISLENENIVKILLENGNAQSSSLSKALKLAISLKNEETVKVLLENGADVNAPVTESSNALKYAISSENEKIVKILLENGNAQSSSLSNALKFAINLGKKNIVQMLVDAGANSKA